MNEAVGHQLDRTDQEIVFRVVSSYYDVLLAAKQLEVADQSANTAKSIMDRSQARFDSGLTVESDLLTAKVRMAARQQDMIRARNTQLWVISADGSGLKQLTFPGTASADVFVSWSPQGNSIVFERDNAALTSFAIYILNVDETGAGEKLIFQGAARPRLESTRQFTEAAEKSVPKHHARLIESGGSNPRWGRAPK